MKKKAVIKIVFGVFLLMLICGSAMAVSKSDLISYYRSAGMTRIDKIYQSGDFTNVTDISIPVMPYPTVIPCTTQVLPTLPISKDSSSIPSWATSIGPIKPFPKPTLLPTPALTPSSQAEGESGIISANQAIEIARSYLETRYPYPVQVTITGWRLSQGNPSYATSNPYWLVSADGFFTDPAACSLCIGIGFAYAEDGTGRVSQYSCVPVGGIVVIDAVTGKVLTVDEK